MDKNGEVTVRLHAAADSNGKVIWPEIFVNGQEVEDISTLRKALGPEAGIRWSLRSWAGITEISADDARVSRDGFLLCLGKSGIRSGTQVECTIIG